MPDPALSCGERLSLSPDQMRELGYGVVDLLVEQPGDPVGQRAGLARARPGDHQRAARRRRHRRELLVVELGPVVDPGAAAGRLAMQRVFAGHPPEDERSPAAIKHRRRTPFVVAMTGLTFMGGALAVPHGIQEAVLTIIGVTLVSIGHFLN